MIHYDVWPDLSLEKKMLADAAFMAQYAGMGYGGYATHARDTESHIKALLARVRELESEVAAMKEKP